MPNIQSNKSNRGKHNKKEVAHIIPFATGKNKAMEGKKASKKVETTLRIARNSKVNSPEMAKQ